MSTYETCYTDYNSLKIDVRAVHILEMNIMKLTSPMTTDLKASFCKTIIGLKITIVKVPLECNIPYIKVDSHYFK